MVIPIESKDGPENYVLEPWKINMEPENRRVVAEYSLRKGQFLGSMIIFPGVNSSLFCKACVVLENIPVFQKGCTKVQANHLLGGH